MLKLIEKYNTTHLSTRTHAKQVFDDLMSLEPSKQVLDFTGIEFSSRSFMVQLYAMLASQHSQARFSNMNDQVEQMYRLALNAYNKPAAFQVSVDIGNAPRVMVLS
ncbi:MAG TPA: hypothetical protein DCE78_12895 [Bacteroidetes bacterium]|nr:hypothetical protein [Bacteroidota bacterium]